jgi:hypothetical protein
VAILFVPAVAYSEIPNDLDEGVILIDYWGLWSKYKNLESNNYIKIGDYLEW